MRLDEIIGKSFLHESVYTNIDSEDSLIKYRDIILNYDKRGNYIYRGMKNTGDVLLGDGNQINRRSVDTKNYYTLLFDYILPEWKKFPKRSQSFICTTNRTTSTSYSTNDGIYLVIPLENQDIGVCGRADIWFSFGDTSPRIVNYQLETMGKYYLDIELNENDPVQLRNDLLAIEKAAREDEKWNHNQHDFYYFKDIQTRSIIDILSILFNPYNNDFYVSKLDKIYTSNAREVWLSGKVLFVKSDVFVNFVLSNMGEK